MKKSELKKLIKEVMEDMSLNKETSIGDEKIYGNAKGEVFPVEIMEETSWVMKVRAKDSDDAFHIVDKLYRNGTITRDHFNTNEDFKIKVLGKDEYSV